MEVKFNPKTYSEMFGSGGIASVQNYQLYGAKITVTETTSDISGNSPPAPPTAKATVYYVYRYIDANNGKTSDTLDFEQTAEDGAGKAHRIKSLDIVGGTPLPISAVSHDAGAAFSVTDSALGPVVTFDPLTSAANPTGELDLFFRDNNGSLRPAGTLALAGTGVPVQEINFDLAGLEQALVDFASNYDSYANQYGGMLSSGDTNLLLPAATKSSFVAAVNADGGETLATQIETSVLSLFSAYDVTITNSLDNPAATVSDTYQAVDPGRDPSLGGDAGILDLDLSALNALLATYSSISPEAQGFQLDQAINPIRSGTPRIILASHIANFWGIGQEAFVNNFAKTIAHESGHNIGLPHPYDYKDFLGNSVNQAQPDIMSYAPDNRGLLTFSVYSDGILKIGLDGNWSTADIENALFYLSKAISYGTTSGTIETFDGSPDGGDLIIDSPPGPHMLLTLNSAAIPTSAGFDVGTVNLGDVATTTINISNLGDQDLIVNAADLNGSSEFALASPFSPTVVHPRGTLDLPVIFAPTQTGSAQTEVTIATNDSATFNHLKLTGQGHSVLPRATVDESNNNLGGVQIGKQAAKSAITIRNDGDQPLVISNISLVGGTENFSLLNVPADLATSPIVLNSGQTFDVAVQFKPGQSGLLRGTVQLVTNDPAQPALQVGLVGTGYQTPFAHVGGDYVAIAFPALGDATTIHTKTDAAGIFNAVLPPSQQYHVTMFDPISGLVADGWGITNLSGRATNVTGSLFFAPSKAPDSDGDGLPDDVEFAIGTSPVKIDTNKDGIDDFTSVKQGLDPLSGFALPTGIVATAALKGTAQDVTIAASTRDPSQLTAYVATGDFGLAIVDVSNFSKPAILAQLDLTGTNNAVAVDASRGLAAVAGGSSGVLHIVDVSDPTAPALVRDVAFANPVTAVALHDGIAYVAEGIELAAVDLATGQVEDTVLTGTLSKLAFDGDTLFTLDVNGTLRAISVSSSGGLTLRGQISMGNVTGLFVGGGIAYVGGPGGQGYSTVDVTDLDHLTLISGVDLVNLVSQKSLPQTGPAS